MLNNTGIALMAGFLLDLAIGDPRWLYHPVRLIGKVIDLLEKIFRKILPKTLHQNRYHTMHISDVVRS